MKQQIYSIQIVGDARDKDKAFQVLLEEAPDRFCGFGKEKYLVYARTLKVLKKNKIKFKAVEE